ncbi:CBS domain-containing protein [Candidatus Bathyarchaeota archaeon]|nr:CBS domain-containing protein [Candidatus Bathyarchaeota archaeon]NIU80781.1 CBS domain-containing protein [Candidatus Bathyarchaeota archaeon]NIV67406.1 CBS domain-containing protein [Candidatus Bathyarchaeota archaeon]NIW15950.1 CBS domain-containing protein [Candidatus Bathyarchaeota archaeon]
MAGSILVRDAMTRSVKTVETVDTVDEAVEKMNKFNIGSVLVMNKERTRPVGIVTERDILRLVERYPEPSLVKVKQIMSQPLVTIPVDASIEEAARLMARKQVKRLPVIEQDKLVGIVSSSDLMRAGPKLVRVLIDLLPAEDRS